MKNHISSRPARAADAATTLLTRRARILRFAPGLLLPALLSFSFATPPACAASDFQTRQAQRFSIDHLRSYVEFQIGFMKFKTVDGTFHDYSGTIMYVREDVTRSSVSAAIQSESIFTGVRPRDRHLRSSDFFDVEKYPVIFFQSSEIRRKNGKLEMVGALTMHGTTRQVAIPFSVAEKTDERTGRTRLHVTGEASLNRHDYGIYGNFWGNKVLSNEVRVEFNLEAVPAESFGLDMAPMKGLKSLEEALMTTLADRDMSALKRRYFSLRRNHAGDYDFSEEALLRISEKLREQGLIEEALELVRFNLRIYPGHEDSWDQVGYLQALGGEVAGAVETYEKLLGLNRYDTRAIEMLRWLKSPLSAQIR